MSRGPPSRYTWNVLWLMLACDSGKAAAPTFTLQYAQLDWSTELDQPCLP